MSKSEADAYQNFLGEDEFSECQACGGNLKKDKVNLEEFEGGKLYIMEQVPSYVCQICGEIWVPAPVIKDFEKMLEAAKRHELTKKLHKTSDKKKTPQIKSKKNKARPKKCRR